MTVPRDLMEAVLRLPEAMRRELGLRLIESTAPHAEGDVTDVEATWASLAQMRITDYRAGNTALMDEAAVREVLDT